MMNDVRGLRVGNDVAILTAVWLRIANHRMGMLVSQLVGKGRVVSALREAGGMAHEAGS
jgi:hypothetical protein